MPFDDAIIIELLVVKKYQTCHNLFNNLCLIKNFSLFSLIKKLRQRSSDIINFQSFQFELVSCNNERFIVGETWGYFLVVVIFQGIANPCGTRLGVVVGVGEATK